MYEHCENWMGVVETGTGLVGRHCRNEKVLLANEGLGVHGTADYSHDLTVLRVMAWPGIASETVGKKSPVEALQADVTVETIRSRHVFGCKTGWTDLIEECGRSLEHQ